MYVVQSENALLAYVFNRGAHDSRLLQHLAHDPTFYAPLKF